MKPEDAHTVLDLIAEMKRDATTIAAKLRAEQLAMGIITQDIGQPIKMADNLKYWLDLCAA